MTDGFLLGGLLSVSLFAVPVAIIQFCSDRAWSLPDLFSFQGNQKRQRFANIKSNVPSVFVGAISSFIALV